jgi:opacity protein-like surface antigen
LPRPGKCEHGIGLLGLLSGASSLRRVMGSVAKARSRVARAFLRVGFAGVALIVAVSVQLGAARAADVQLQKVAFPDYRFYVGVGGFGVHHTGYVPNSTFNSEAYRLGFKGFAGWRFADHFAFEASLDYLGSNTFDEGLATPSTERSVALTGTVLAFTPPLSEWLFPTLVPVRAFARGGLAFKNIHQEAADGTFNEGILSFVIGGGADFDISPRWFVRGEYEFISSAVGGPSQPFPALNGLFTANFGGTHRVINVMHTELAVSLGYRF